MSGPRPAPPRVPQLRAVSGDAHAGDTLRMHVDVPSAPPPPPAVQRAARPVLVGTPLFREEAVQAYLRGDQDGVVLRVAPLWTSALFWFLASLVTIAIVASVVGHIDLTSRGRGVLRPVGGVQILSAQSPGLVSEVRARSGDTVSPGDPILQLDSASVKASLLEADRHLAVAQSNLKTFLARQKTLYEERQSLLRGRIVLLQSRVASQSETIARLRAKLARFNRMEDEGLANKNDVDVAAEDLSSAQRQKLSLEEELSQTRVQIAGLASDIESELTRLRADVQEAQAKRDALAFSLQQTTVVAPRAGRLESVLVHPGDMLTAGSAIGKLVPGDAPTQIISFVAERDRAFLEPGAIARVEIDQLPVSEFGALEARITRVASDLASNAEVREALGDQADVAGPVYRVELSLVNDAQAAKLARFIRPGILLSVRYTLRKRRVITLLVEPLRRWLE